MLKTLFGRGKNNASEVVDNTKLLKAPDQLNEIGDKELQKFALPNQVFGFSDLTTQHMKGNQFQYVAITHPVKESEMQQVNELHSFNPDNGKEAVELKAIPKHELIQQTEVLKVKDLSTALGKIKKRYLLIHKVIVAYAPLMSYYGKFSDLVIGLHDDRMIDETLVNSICMNTNISNCCLLGFDYCIPATSLDKISLSFTTPQFLIGGEPWGVVQVQLSVFQLDFPIQTSVRPVRGILRMPESAMHDLKTNPRKLTMTVSGADVERLKTFHRDGDLIDISRAKEKTLRDTAYAKTQGYVGNAITEDSDDSSYLDTKPMQQSEAILSFMDEKHSHAKTLKGIKKPVNIKKARFDAVPPILRAKDSIDFGDADRESLSPSDSMSLLDERIAV